MNEQQPTWTVIAQQPVSGLDAMGHYVPGWQVTYRVNATNTTGHVFVPQTEYNVDNVRARITDQVAHVIAVHNLQG